MIGFAIGFIVGSLATTAWAIFVLVNSEAFRRKLQYYLDLRDGIEFREMPDRGLNELIYKPRDGQTTLSRSVIVRRRRPEKRSG